MDFSLWKKTKNKTQNHNEIAWSVEHGFDMRTGGKHPCLKRAMQSY